MTMRQRLLAAKLAENIKKQPEYAKKIGIEIEHKMKTEKKDKK